MTYEKFVEFYQKHGKCINDVSRPKKPHTEEKLKEKYEKLLKQFERNKEKKEEQAEKFAEYQKEKAEEIDLNWIETRNGVFERDKGKCQLIAVLEDLGMYELVTELRESAKGFIKIIDPAHIYPKGSYPELKYDPDNVICLNRFSHSNLDTLRDPIDGKEAITIIERLKFFEQMVGEERMNRLKSKINLTRK